MASNFEKPPKKTRTSISIKSDLLKKLVATKKREKITISSAVEQILEKYYNENPTAS